MRLLKKTSLAWSLKHLLYDGDTDLLPRPFEIEIIKSNWDELSKVFQKIDITNHLWKGVRYLLVPKDEFLFRRICQLDPIDSLLFAAIMREIGGLIEKHRIPENREQVFSYRFNPVPKGHFYGETNLWDNFWDKSINNAQTSGFVAITDITDFYNQIYHHTIENQLDLCKVDKAYRTAIINLLKNATQGISRGIPIGPHASHILAELSLIALDNFLSLKSYKFCRYVDDIHIFCTTREEAQIAIYELADFLDKTQKLSLNKGKTKILTNKDFLDEAHSMLIDDPINSEEEVVIKVIKCKVPLPYTRIKMSKLSPEDLKKLSKDRIESILECYTYDSNTNYVRLRWLLRRLS